MAALFAGRFAGAGDLTEVSRAARGLCAVHSPQPAALVLDALTMLVTDGPSAAAPALRQVARVFTSDSISAEEELRWGWLAQAAASALWDDVPWRTMLLRQVQLARDVGALDQLPIDLASLGTATAWTGDLTAVSALIAEADAVRAATGSRTAPFAAMLLASLRGDQAEATPLIEAAIADAPARGQGIAATYAHWAAAILANGLGRYADALAAAKQASQDSPALFVAMWALPELIEAATRTGKRAHRQRRARAAGGNDAGGGDGLRVGDGGTVAGAGERGRDGRALLPRGDRPAGPHPAASGAGPRSSALRRMAAPREPAPGRPRRAQDRL